MHTSLKIYLLGLLLLPTLNFGQDPCECYENEHVIDTASVIRNVREHYSVLTSINTQDFDYIYTRKYDIGCHEPELVTETTCYLDDQIVISSKTIYGSGQGDIQTNTTSTSYFLNGVEIFNFLINQSDSYRADSKSTDSYKEEIRSYYDECGFLVRKLDKKATLTETGQNRDYDKVLIKKENVDITHSKQKTLSTHQSPSLPCVCGTDTSNIDTTTVIKKVRERFRYIESLQEQDFDYIFRTKYDDGCNEPNEIASAVYYLDGKIVMTYDEEIGSGEGGIQSSTWSNTYYQNENKIFSYSVYEVDNTYNLKATLEDSYKEEYRTYYNECGTLVKKLYKKVTKADIDNNESYEDVLSQTANTDITNK